MSGIVKYENRDLDSNIIPGGDKWKDGLVLNKDQMIIASLPNARRILMYHPYLRDCFGWSEIDEDAMLMRPLPDMVNEGIRAPDADGDYPQAITEKFHSYLLDIVCSASETNFNDKQILRAVTNAASQNPYNPIRDYLESLEWDGDARLSSWLTRALAVADTPLNSSIGQRFLVAACRRGVFKKYKFDSMLILEGEKGIRKSTACRVLFGDNYFLEGLGSINDIETIKTLAGKWGVEIAEMKAFSKTDAEAQKAFLSTVSDTYRRPFAPKSVTVDRRCVFIATTNQNEYILEKGGDRRFWPVKCGEVGETDIQWLIDNRDQLWAEAYYYAKDFSFKTYMEDEESEQLTASQSDRVMGNPWENIIMAWLTSEAGGGVTELTTERIAIEILDIPKHQQDKGTSIKIGIIMKDLGWQKVRRRSHGVDKYVFIKPA